MIVYLFKGKYTSLQTPANCTCCPLLPKWVTPRFTCHFFWQVPEIWSNFHTFCVILPSQFLNALWVGNYFDWWEEFGGGSPKGCPVYPLASSLLCHFLPFPCWLGLTSSPSSNKTNRRLWGPRMPQSVKMSDSGFWRRRWSQGLELEQA